MNRSIRLPFALAAAALITFVAAATPSASLAKAKPAPSPTPTVAPSPSPTPEPLDVAIPRLEAKIKADPNDKQSMIELAQDYYSINRPDLALGLSQKAIAGGLKTAQAYYVDGISQISVGHEKESIADLETAATIDPTNSAVLDTLTNLYLRANRPSDAERVAKRAVTFNKDNKDAYVTLGQVYNAEKKYDDARAQYEIAEKIDPKDVHAIVLEGQSYAAQNAIALASQMFDRAIALDPTSQ